MSRNYTGMGRYEQLIDQLDAATSRLESRWEAIDRRLTKLQASKAAYGQQPYAGFNSGVNNAAWSPPPPPRRRPTCWDPPWARKNTAYPPFYPELPYRTAPPLYQQPPDPDPPYRRQQHEYQPPTYQDAYQTERAPRPRIQPPGH